MIKGNVWKFGNNVDTDQILPSQYLLLPDFEEMKKYTFETVDRDFHLKVKPGDVIVAGENFGSGSSREQAPGVLKALGIGAVIAKSFARIFFRNAINIGLPVLVCRDIYENADEGDALEVDPESGTIRNLISGAEFASTRLPEHIRAILQSNGLIEYLNNR